MRSCWACRMKGLAVKPFAYWYYYATDFGQPLCKECLDVWLDNADDDPELEPSNVIFL